MISRRRFIQSSLASALVAPNLIASSLDGPRKLRIAAIGVGNQGFRNIKGMQSEDMVALCDVDSGFLAKGSQMFPEAKTFQDFRIMLRELRGEIDAVAISTPDHTHFPAAIMALGMGKHVFLEKPMAHSVAEVRMLMAEAENNGVVTQMGNQGHAFEGTRLIREWYEAGLIGEVREVAAWTNRPVNGVGFISEQMEYAAPSPVPGSLDWDLWVGPVTDAPEFSKGMYAPRDWRGWWKFGMGGLGDIGCHTLDSPFWALDLEIPHKVEVEVEHVNPIFTPPGSVVKFHCRQRGTGEVVPVSWYEGPRMPAKPGFFGEDELDKRGGLMIVGSEGIIYHPSLRPNSPRLYPKLLWRDFRKNPSLRPEKKYPRIKGGHIQEWIRACKGEGPTPGSSFDYAGQLSEMIVLGTLAIRTGQDIDYDAEEMKITNNPEADALLRTEARPGFRTQDLVG
ncbi:MAG: Gfo/Idh/MocA family oxidoreductase [Verrucomicrobiota bacterium]